MPLDIDDGYKKIKKEVTTKQKYNQVKKDIKQLEKKAGDSFEDWGGGLESKFGNNFSVDKNDPGIYNGTYTIFSKGKTIVRDNEGNINSDK